MRHPAVAVLLLASPAAHTLAAPAPAPDTSAVDELDQITVTATLTERELGAVPLVISQIDRERLDETLVNDLEDLDRVMEIALREFNELYREFYSASGLRAL